MLSKETELKDAIESASINLEKAMTVLRHMDNDYLQWRDKPSPVAAMEWLHKSPGYPMGEQEELHGRRSVEWCEYYHEIVGFINIIGDYINESQMLMEQAMNSPSK